MWKSIDVPLYYLFVCFFSSLLLPNKKKLKFERRKGKKKAGKMRRNANDKNKNDVKNSAGLTVSTDVQID